MSRTIFHAPRTSDKKLRAAIENMVDTAAESRHRDLFVAMCDTLRWREEDGMCHRADVMRDCAKGNA